MNQPKFDPNKTLSLGKRVIKIEADAVFALQKRINDSFVTACEYLLRCTGRIVVIGMGKSGHIANKIAATLASTGSPAFYVHPGDASHGDLGMITRRDVVIAISNSGNTPEIITILPLLKHLKVSLIAITGNPESPLSKQATINLDASVTKEACPLGLAPTASTTTALAMGDALSIALLEARGFTANDFALSHPGGALGKRLLLKIDDLIRVGDAIPKVTTNTYLNKTLIEMNIKRLGMTTVVDEHDDLIGIFTDGDLRRAVDKGLDIYHTKVSEIMTTECKTTHLGLLAYEALQLMEQHQITTLVVTANEKQVIGIIHIHDLLRTGIV